MLNHINIILFLGKYNLFDYTYIFKKCEFLELSISLIAFNR